MKRRDRNHTTAGSSAMLSHLALAASLGWIATTVNAAPMPIDPDDLPDGVSIVQMGDFYQITVEDNNTVINFLSFDIGSNETVQFIQGANWHRVLNQVMGDFPTYIDGTLLANGQIFITNPAGIFFGGGAFVDVGAIYAAAGSINADDFAAGNPNLVFNLTDMVVNEGVIRGNAIHLMGTHVENHGVLTADAMGDSPAVIMMLAGDKVILQQQEMMLGSIFVEVSGGAGGTGVMNTGVVEAEGYGANIHLGAGDIYSVAVNNSGLIHAVDGGSTINMTAGGGNILNTGIIEASAEDSAINMYAEDGDIIHIGDDAEITGGSITMTIGQPEGTDKGGGGGGDSGHGIFLYQDVTGFDMLFDGPVFVGSTGMPGDPVDLLATGEGEDTGFVHFTGPVSGIIDEGPGLPDLTVTADTILFDDILQDFGSVTTDGIDVTFSEITSVEDLLVLASGDTSFTDLITDVGSLTTDAGGQTFIFSDMFADSLTFGDMVTIEAEAAILSATDSITFDSMLIGLDHDLTLITTDATFGRIYQFGEFDVQASGTTTFTDLVSDIELLTTDAPGTTSIQSDISAETMIFGDAVDIDAVVFLIADELVEFQSTVDGPFSLSINSGGDLIFADDVGASDPLSDLEIDVDGVTHIGGNLVQATGDILINPSGRGFAGPFATIASLDEGDLEITSTDGDIFFGPNEKVTIEGDLIVRAPNGIATVSDLNALNDLNVDASEIFLQARESGLVFENGTLIADQGLDFVAGGTIDFSVVPVAIRSGLVQFSTPTGFGGSSTLSGFIFRAFGPVTANALRFAGSVIDLRAQGPTVTNLSESLAGLIPRDAQTEAVSAGVNITAAEINMLRQMQLFARELDQNEHMNVQNALGMYFDVPDGLDHTPEDREIVSTSIPRHRVAPTFVLFTELFTKESVDPDTGETIRQPRYDEVQAMLTDAWNDYAQRTELSDLTAEEQGIGFRQFVQADEGSADAAAYLANLDSLFNDLELLGPTPVEVRYSQQFMAGLIANDAAGMGEDQLLAAAGVTP